MLLSLLQFLQPFFFVQGIIKWKTTNVVLLQSWSEFVHKLHLNMLIVEETTKPLYLDVRLDWRLRPKPGKKKVKKSQAKNKQPANKGEVKEESVMGHDRIKMDLEATSWAKYPKEQSFDPSSFEDSWLENSQKTGNVGGTK